MSGASDPIGPRAFRRLFAAAAACALAGGGASLAGWIVAPSAFYPAWLAAFCYALGLPLGALALLMIHELTGGKWEALARPVLEAAAGTLPLFIVFYLPVVAGLHELYPWMRPERAAHLANRWYLNPDFFGIRAACYFVVWTLFAFLQLHRPHGEGVSPPSAQWRSGIGLILLGYTASYASFDWIMSIEPDWFSSIYGMVVGAGWFIVALAFALLAIALGARPAALPEEAARRHLASLATILLAVVIFWGYTDFSQWLIIWEENLRSEIGWYLLRLRAGWRALVLAIAALHLVIPLIALVWSPAKRSRRVVGAVCALLLLADLLQAWWLVLPPFHAAGLAWLAPAAAIGLLGFWSCAFLWQLRRGLLLFPRLRARQQGAAP